ncbi:Biopolymer transport protein ExbD/TolR [Pirellula staleyi DSM 6068]|uniref:Biopolymer transport protein ExbD/TolR n=1 Tax=Pirellula staleyi (strain ATCC 27377 / DSM 6068 / ICPB 4128) TaxID=530564 RepID=D2R8K7_PIRSD|nr:biopolymer transporter ExbD [Pirellula staleyi]ADB17548.1 Biopolymer transport protein ExbD/TolR [Pirellula staleyi DSM 6068]
MAVKINKGKALDLFNLTPMIDMVFLLLIFFLVASRFEEEDRELDVELPSASEARPQISKPKEIYVNVDSTGKMFVDGRVVSSLELDRFLTRAAVDNPLGQTVVIRADKRVELDSVVVVMNLCNKAGIRDYSLTTAGEP